MNNTRSAQNGRPKHFHQAAVTACRSPHCFGRHVSQTENDNDITKDGFCCCRSFLPGVIEVRNEMSWLAAECCSRLGGWIGDVGGWLCCVVATGCKLCHQHQEDSAVPVSTFFLNFCTVEGRVDGESAFISYQWCHHTFMWGWKALWETVQPWNNTVGLQRVN